MSSMLRVPDLSLGELERAVLEALWSQGEMTPTEVYEAVGVTRAITLNTVASALRRLHDKELLAREKVSHSYVYRARITKTELQRMLIGALAEQFGEDKQGGLFAAFVDFAESCGDETLRRMERLISARLGDTEK